MYLINTCNMSEHVLPNVQIPCKANGKVTLDYAVGNINIRWTRESLVFLAEFPPIAMTLQFFCILRNKNIPFDKGKPSPYLIIW